MKTIFFKDILNLIQNYLMDIDLMNLCLTCSSWNENFNFFLKKDIYYLKIMKNFMKI